MSLKVWQKTARSRPQPRKNGLFRPRGVAVFPPGQPERAFQLGIREAKQRQEELHRRAPGDRWDEPDTKSGPNKVGDNRRIVFFEGEPKVKP